MQTAWNQAKTRIHKKIPHHRFMVWIDPLRLIKNRDDEIEFSKIVSNQSERDRRQNSAERSVGMKGQKTFTESVMPDSWTTGMQEFMKSLRNRTKPRHLG